MKKWLVRLGIALAIAVVLMFSALCWLLQTESGARFALERAKLALAGKLDLALAKGAIVGPLELHDVAWRDPQSGIEVRAKTVKVEYAFWGLLHKSLHVRSVDLDGVDVALITVPVSPPAAPPLSLKQLLAPPLDITVDQLHVGKLNVTQDGKPAFAGDSLDAAVSWTAQALLLPNLVLRAADGKVEVSGALTTYDDLRGNAKLALDWNIGDAAKPQRAVATIDFANDGRQAHFAVAATQPLAANAIGTLAPNDKALPWTLNLDVPQFDPSKIGGGESLKTLALKIGGSGDRNGGSVNGNVDLNAHRVLLDPAKFALTPQLLTIESLHLHSPEAAGGLDAQGKVQLDAKPIVADLKLAWQGVEIPPDLAGQLLVTHGALGFSGSADKYGADGRFSLGPPGKPADFTVKLDGTPQKIALHEFALKQPKGGLSATGEVALQPKIGWTLDAKANRLDPGAFAKDWPGAVNFAVSTTGNMEQDGPAGKLKLESLSGTLRGRALAGHGNLVFAAPAKVDGRLDLSSGNSTVALAGSGGAQTDLNIDLHIASLGDWLPKTGGSVQGRIAAKGAWPKLDASGKVDGAKIVVGDTHLETFALAFDLHDLSAPNGTATLDAKTLATGGYVFDTVKLSARGDQAAHHAEFDARGKPLALAATLDGGVQNQDWRGTLSSLTLALQNQPSWTLDHPAALGVTGDGAFTLAQTCLRSGTPALCATLSQDAKSGMRAKVALEHLPLAMLARLASPDSTLKLEGEINGNGDIAQNPAGVLSGTAMIASESGSVWYPDSAEQSMLSYKALHVDATLGDTQNTITLGGELNDGGRLDGQITIGAMNAGAAPLSGNISAHLASVGFVDVLTTKVSGTRGKLNAKFTFSGTTTKPGVDGELALAGFATEVPSAGLKLHDGNISVRSRDGENFDIDGTVAGSEGKLAIKGNAGIAPDAPIAITLKGEDFLAADIPGAKVHISPDLKLDRDAKHFVITGSIGVPQAAVDLAKLPGGGALATPSPDIELVGEKPRAAAPTSPIAVDIAVKLGAGEKLAMDLRQGSEVHLVGFGLNADLAGQLAISELPGREPIGRGQVQLNGTYKAYGQDLKIEQGRLLFAGTPVENPGLDIRATRGFSDPQVTVGLQVRGTALKPQLTVFSSPAMEQSDALSYLVAGKPLSALRGGEGNAVSSAASALGTAGGDLLAKSIGTKIGLDDVGIAESSSVGGAALTVGKYLSPRVYMSYGVGLFTPGQVVTLRYKLTRLFNFELANGTLSSRAGFNYKVEK